MARGERVICVSRHGARLRAAALPAHRPGAAAGDPARHRPGRRSRARRSPSRARARARPRMHPALGRRRPAAAAARARHAAEGPRRRAGAAGGAARPMASMRGCGCRARASAGREAYIAELEARGSRAGHRRRGRVHRRRPTRIARAYAASDLVLQLSRKPEAFGRTVVEALAVGRPGARLGPRRRRRTAARAAARGRGAAVRRGRAGITCARELLAAPADATGYDSLHPAGDAGRHACRLCRTPPTAAAADPRTPRPHRATGWRWAPAWVLAFVALWPAPGLCRGVLVLGALAAIVQLVHGALPRRRCAAQRPGLGADQRAVLRVLAAGAGVRARLRSTSAARCARRRSTCATCRSCGWWRRPWPTTRGRRTTFGGLAVIVGGVDARCAGPGRDRHQSVVLRHRRASSRRSAVAACAPRRKSPASTASAACWGRATSSWAWCWPACRRSCCSPRGAASAPPAGWWPPRPSALVILLAGSRASWITYAPGARCSRAGACWAGRSCWRVFAFGALALAVLTAASPQVRERIERTAHVLAADEAGVDMALSGRARIWGAATCMVREHPVNGVGARGFREAFPACDPSAGTDRRLGRRPGAARAPDRAGGAQRDRRVRPAAVAGRRGAGVARLALRRCRPRASARARRCWRWR